LRCRETDAISPVAWNRDGESIPCVCQF
jgi:hypothetical protein